MRSSVSLYIPHREEGKNAGLVETLYTCIPVVPGPNLDQNTALLIEIFLGLPQAFQMLSMLSYMYESPYHLTLYSLAAGNVAKLPTKKERKC
jgi:hypothetical protein